MNEKDVKSLLASNRDRVQRALDSMKGQMRLDDEDDTVVDIKKPRGATKPAKKTPANTPPKRPRKPTGESVGYSD